MLFTRPYRIIFLFVIVLSACLSGCTTVTSKYSIKSVSGNKERISYLHESAYTYFCAGYFSMLSKDWQSAIDNFEKASLIDKNSERILQHLATCYYQSGNIEKSINCIEKLVKIKPDEFNIHYTLATLYESLGKRHESIMEYERARKCRTDNLDKVFLADTLYRLANLYMDEELMEKGAECYKSMFDMKLVSDPAKIYYEIGQRYFEKNDIKKALEYFLKVKGIDPKLNYVSFYLALCYGSLNDFNNAIKESNLFLEKEPDNWYMHLALSEIYEKINNESQSREEIIKTEEILKKNIESGSKNSNEYFMLCQIYRKQQKVDDAISVIECMKLIHLDNEKKRDAHFLLANLYYEVEKLDKVEEELRMALKLDPDSHEANNFLGYLFVENNKDLDEAITLINKALKIQPKNGAYIDSLGWAYYKKAQIEGKDDYLIIALKKLSEACKLMEEPDIYEHVGDVYYSLGHWNEAVIAWGKAHTLYKKLNYKETQTKNITAKLESIHRLISAEKSVLTTVANHAETENTLKP